MASPLFTPTRRRKDRLTGFDDRRERERWYDHQMQYAQQPFYMLPKPKKIKRSPIFNDVANPVMYSPPTIVRKPVVIRDEIPQRNRRSFWDTVTPEQYIIVAAIGAFWAFLGYQYTRANRHGFSDTWNWVLNEEESTTTTTLVPGSTTTTTTQNPTVDHPFTDFTDQELDDVVEEITFDPPPADKAVVGGKTVDLEDVLSHAHFGTANKITLRDGIRKRDNTNRICSGLTLTETGTFLKERGICTDNDLRGLVLSSNKLAEREIKTGNYPLYKECVFNMIGAAGLYRDSGWYMNSELHLDDKRVIDLGNVCTNKKFN